MSNKVLAGRYELFERIGEGGMSVVYKAKDKLLNRFVAIKILKPQFINDHKFIDSFRRESFLQQTPERCWTKCTCFHALG